MKRLAQIVIGLTIGLTTAAASGDTLILKNGERVSGFFEGGTARVVTFRAADGVVRDYDIMSVERLQFGDLPAPASAATTTAPPPAPLPIPAVTPSTAAPAPRLLAGGEKPPEPVQTPAAKSNPKFTLATGNTITIRMVDSVNSEKQKIGDAFLSVLDEPIIQDGVELVPKGVDVRGRISSVTEAGRATGAAQLSLELTQIMISGVNYALTTSEYNEIGESRSPQTGRRAVGGAGLGAIIGAIAGGGRGAAIGAGIGAGAGVASTVLTKGEKLNIPPETRLQFTLKAPLIVGQK
jgi:hypothetical protein